MKLNDDLKTILSVASYILCLFLISYIDNPMISYIPFALWLLYLMYVSYQKVVYGLGKVNYLLFPTYNDGYTKMTAIIFGVLLSIGCVLLFVFDTDIGIYLFILGFCLSMLIMFNGIYHLPNGKIEISGNKMLIAGHHQAFDLKSVKQIELQHNRILVKHIDDSVVRIENLNIDEHWIARISNYIISYAPQLSIASAEDSNVAVLISNI